MGRQEGGSRIKVIVAGSRGFDSYRLLKFKLRNLLMNVDLTEVEIVSGGARGADSLGERFAREHGCKIKRFIPDWDSLGKQAGFVRNWEMAKYADACVVFWDGKSKGAKHMMDLARKEELKLRIVRY